MAYIKLYSAEDFLSAVRILCSAIALVLTIPSTALAERTFTVSKLCSLSQAPDGFERKPDFFNVLSAAYVTPYEIYENEENTSILISNMKGGCWVRIDSTAGPWTVIPVWPVGGAIEFDNSRSRRLAVSMLEDKVLSCENEGIQEKTIRKIYFFDQFKKEFSIPKCNDCRGICYFALGYGTVAIRLDQLGHTVIADIVAGTAIVGEVQ